MSDFSVVQNFIDHVTRVRCEEGLREALGQITSDLGFDYFALVHHVDLRSPRAGRLVALWSYPDAWVSEYIERNLVTDDPVHLASHRTNIGFSWEEVPKLIEVTPRHQRVRQDTQRAGIVAGYTVPANIPGEANGSCSFAIASGGSLPQPSLAAAQLAGSFAFNAARNLAFKDLKRFPMIKLTARQLECLVFVGRGKTDSEIGTILGIAADTVTEHLDEARRRYDVVKRTQLVLRAVFDGQLAISDVLR